MRRDGYEEFASVYDEWQRLYPQPFSIALSPRIEAAVRAHGAPAPVLADVACGTGIFALWWKRKHPEWTVYGCDGSHAMIRAARRKRGEPDGGRAGRPRRPSAGGTASPGGIRHPRSGGPGTLTPIFLVQDLRETALPEPAGVLTCLFDSLNHLLRISDLRRALSRAHDALLPGGLLLFDLIDDRSFARVFTGTSILDGENLYGGMETQFRWQDGVGIGRAEFTFFRRGGARWRRLDFDVRERRWMRSEVRSLLRASGLRLLELQRIDPYKDPEFYVPRTFWICRKER